MPQAFLTTAVQVGSILGASATVAMMLFTKMLPWLRTKLSSRKLYRQPHNVLERDEIERAIRYYIPPMCQSIDPADADDPAIIVAGREKLFDLLDEALGKAIQYHCIFILGDSGMGKTSALVNYQVRHLRRRRSYKLELVPLGIPNADKRIQEIDDKRNTVLFLDAFDEDTQAMVDHVERMRLLLRDTSDFRRVVITCRTQFFSKDEEIPQRTGIIRLGPRSAGEPAEYLFHKIYLSPFSDKEVTRYLHQRYPFWRRKERQMAYRVVKKMPHLRFRPMLLAHVDDLIHSPHEIQFSYQVYEEMVEAWLVREQGFVPDKSSLRHFSELLAVEIFVGKSRRSSERIPREEIKELARRWKIAIDDWLLTGRSLLNRDAEGNYKFAHRSIMEYFCVMSLASGNAGCVRAEWTDQMEAFLAELLNDFSISDSLRQRILRTLASAGARGGEIFGAATGHSAGLYFPYLSALLFKDGLLRGFLNLVSPDSPENMLHLARILKKDIDSGDYNLDLNNACRDATEFLIYVSSSFSP